MEELVYLMPKLMPGYDYPMKGAGVITGVCWYTAEPSDDETLPDEYRQQDPALCYEVVSLECGTKKYIPVSIVASGIYTLERYYPKQ